MDKLNEETLLISQTKQETQWNKWNLYIYGNLIQLDNKNYLNYCLQKTSILLEENKNLRQNIPLQNISQLKNHIYDLEELLEFEFTISQKLIIRTDISALKRIARCIYYDHHPHPHNNLTTDPFFI